MSDVDPIDEESLEQLLISFRNIASILSLALEGENRKTDQYAAIEGAIQLADFQERKLSKLLRNHH